MGNCIRHEKFSWADEDDWGSHNNNINVEKKKEIKLVGGNRDASNCREVKITISKKELEQLVQKVEMMQGLISLEQVLVRMVKGDQDINVHRSWKPVLQTIPEVN